MHYNCKPIFTATACLQIHNDPDQCTKLDLFEVWDINCWRVCNKHIYEQKCNTISCENQCFYSHLSQNYMASTTYTFLERILFLYNSSKRYVDYVSRVMYDSQSSNTIKVHHIEPIQLKINPFVRNQRVIFHIFHLLYVGIPTSYRVFEPWRL